MALSRKERTRITKRADAQAKSLAAPPTEAGLAGVLHFYGDDDVVDAQVIGEPEPVDTPEPIEDALLPGDPEPASPVVKRAFPSIVGGTGKELATLRDATAQQLPGRKLTLKEIAGIVNLNADGLTNVAIAKRLNVTRNTIGRVLAEFGDNRDIARMELNRKAPTMVADILQKGNAAELTDVARSMGVIGERKRDTGKGGHLTIQMGGAHTVGIAAVLALGGDDE